MHQLSVSSNEITKESFIHGFPLDASSITGFGEIQRSDLILVPDQSTFQILPDFFDSDHEEPAYVSKAARMFAFVQNGYEKKEFSHDSRSIAKKAEDFAKKAGLTRHTGLPNWNFLFLTKCFLLKPTMPI
jgi:glutamine synthetase